MKLPRNEKHPRAAAMVSVSRQGLALETEQRIKSLLRFPNPAFYKAEKSGNDTTGISVYVRAYRKLLSCYQLPRHSPWHKLGMRSPLMERFPVEPVVPLEFSGKLRDYQEPIWKAMAHKLAMREDGILILRCGGGKTFLGVKAFAWLQQPTLVVVTQLFIGEQWKKTVEEFTNLPSDEIGMIGDGKAEWDRAFVVATLQSLAQKEFPPEFYKRFGLTIYDECHRLGAEHFSKVAPMFTGIRLGVTATLNRSDKMDKLIKLHLGHPFYEDKEQALKPRVYFYATDLGFDLKGYQVWKGSRPLYINISKVISKLSKMPERQVFVRDWVKKAYRKDRKVLVLSERVEELKDHKEMLAEDDIDAGICVGTLDGRSTTQDAKQRALKKPVILATSQLVKEGLDKPDIDTLIIEYPQSSETFSEQAAGRILREVEDKMAPVVVIFYDNKCSLWKRGDRQYPFIEKAAAMEATFRKLGYDIVKGVE